MRPCKTEDHFLAILRRLTTLERNQKSGRCKCCYSQRANKVPSGLTATDHTSCVWPSSLASWLPESRSHRRTVRSQLAETRERPAGAKADLASGRMRSNL